MDNFEICYACKYGLLFHPNYIKKFIDIHLNKRSGKKYIIIAYRLIPNLHEYIELKDWDKYYDIIKGIKFPLKHLSDTEFIYNSHFYQTNLTIDSFMECNCCKTPFCPIHEKMAPSELVEYKPGKLCNVCHWCLSTQTTENIVNHINNYEKTPLQEVQYN
jgi:hypothetical protein